MPPAVRAVAAGTNSFWTLCATAGVDVISAVADMNLDRDMAAIEELMRLDKIPSAAQLKKGAVNFAELLTKPTSSRETPAVAR